MSCLFSILGVKYLLGVLMSFLHIVAVYGCCVCCAISWLCMGVVCCAYMHMLDTYHRLGLINTHKICDPVIFNRKIDQIQKFYFMYIKSGFLADTTDRR